MSVNSELEERILSLPSKDRAALARKIILSLEPPDFDANASAAWEIEIERRAAQIDRGEVNLIGWRSSIARARRAITRREKA